MNEAKDKFEELDYHIVRDDKHFLKYEKVCNNTKFVVAFDKYDQSFTNYSNAYSRFFIDAKLNEAIQLQLQEFGWLWLANT